MSQKHSVGFATIQKMVRDHLRDAEKKHTTSGDNVGPTPDQCYTAAFSTATGAYAGRGISVKEWQELHDEVREHQAAFK